VCSNKNRWLEKFTSRKSKSHLTAITVVPCTHAVCNTAVVLYASYNDFAPNRHRKLSDIKNKYSKIVLGNSKFAPVVVGGVIHRSQATTKANNWRPAACRSAYDQCGWASPVRPPESTAVTPASTTGTVHAGSIVSVRRPPRDCSRLPFIAV